MKKKGKNHGGARPGAGRPRLSASPATRTLTFRIPLADLERLERAGIANLSRFYIEAAKTAIALLLLEDSAPD